MHLQVLGSGSRGNSALVRAGEAALLVDAGLSLRELDRRLELVHFPARQLQHVLLTHGHLDHARSAGALAKRHKLTVHCCQRLMNNASVKRAPRFQTLRVGAPTPVESARGQAELSVTPVLLPHDADPTVAFRLAQPHADGERVAVILTDMGQPEPAVARALRGAHVLVLEFNHDTEMLRNGPYTAALKRRVGGSRGHLSNAEAAQMLRAMAGPELHTLVLAHLSEKNNTPELARRAAQAVLDELELGHVRVLIAEQDAVGPNLDV